MTRESITEHEGRKYIRQIYSAVNNAVIDVDVYEVLEAFEVEGHALGHAIKKLLCCGNRGKGDRRADLLGAMAALNRAIDMEIRRLANLPKEIKNVGS